MPKENPKRARWLAARLAGHDVRSAARVADVAERVAYGWNSEPGTQATMAEHRADLLASATARCLAEITASFDTLADIRDDGDAPHSARANAARAILGMAVPLVTTADHDRRLAEVETILSAATARPTLGVAR